MQNKRDSYTREDLLASSQGELWPQGPQLPAPNMLMMDRITKCLRLKVISVKV